MITVLQIFFVLVLIVVIILFVFRIRRTREIIHLPDNYKEILSDYVKFYRQLDEEGKMSKCDFVLINDEQQLLIPQVLELNEKLIALSKQKNDG